MPLPKNSNICLERNLHIILRELPIECYEFNLGKSCQNALRYHSVDLSSADTYRHYKESVTIFYNYETLKFLNYLYLPQYKLSPTSPYCVFV